MKRMGRTLLMTEHGKSVALLKPGEMRRVQEAPSSDGLANKRVNRLGGGASDDASGQTKARDLGASRRGSIVPAGGGPNKLSPGEKKFLKKELGEDIMKKIS